MSQLLVKAKGTELDTNSIAGTKPKRTTNRLDDGIFGWYKYIQDFTGDFALEWISSLAKEGDVIWDPFSGSGTTLLAAKHLGFKSYGYDISPFMVDVARTKVDWSLAPSKIEDVLEKVLKQIPSHEPETEIRFSWEEYETELARLDIEYPADKKLSKWISPQVVIRVQSLMKAIESVKHHEGYLFLRLAAASILIPASNMTFRPNICYERYPIKDFPVRLAFYKRAKQMLSDYRKVYKTSSSPCHVNVGDARTDGPKQANLIFTSPPYPNDMEYVHQTRLELALLAYVENAKGLTNLKKQMISSSVKLVYRENEWQKTAGLEVPTVNEAYQQIAKTLEGKNWGWNPADMTAQYFGGMRSVLKNWHKRLPSGGIAAVVIGDSAFNGIKVETDVLLSETAKAEGFRTNDIHVFRSRWNSKHDIELRESVVLLEKRAN